MGATNEEMTQHHFEAVMRRSRSLQDRSSGNRNEGVLKEVLPRRAYRFSIKEEPKVIALSAQSNSVRQGVSKTDSFFSSSNSSQKSFRQALRTISLGRKSFNIDSDVSSPRIAKVNLGKVNTEAAFTSLAKVCR